VNSNKQYIACQSPLKDTCEDFWDMIIQYKIEKIVMLGNFQDNNHSELVRFILLQKKIILLFYF